ncbi:unnamed protein product [Closterium sp. NIES-54]
MPLAPCVRSFPQCSTPLRNPPFIPLPAAGVVGGDSGAAEGPLPPLRCLNPPHHAPRTPLPASPATLLLAAGIVGGESRAAEGTLLPARAQLQRFRVSSLALLLHHASPCCSTMPRPVAPPRLALLLHHTSPCRSIPPALGPVPAQCIPSCIPP